MGKLHLEWHLFLTMPKEHFNFGVYCMWICWHPHVPFNISIITPWEIHYLWGPWEVECIKPSLDISGNLCLSFSHIGSCRSVHVSGITCLRSIQTMNYTGTKLDGGVLASHSSQHIGRHFSRLSCHKGTNHGCFSRPGAQGFSISSFNPLGTQR